MQVGDPAHDGGTRGHADLLGHLGQQRPEHRARGYELGEACAIALRPSHERVDVPQRRTRAVVREPRQDHRGWRRRGTTGKAKAEVVDRLEQRRGARVDLGIALAQEQRVPGRVGAAGRRCPTGDAYERQHLVRREALHTDRSADDLRDEIARPGVGPQQHVARGKSVAVNRNGRSPLTGDRHGVQGIAVGIGCHDRLTRGRQDADPPLRRILRRGTVETDVHLHRLHRGAQHVALKRHHRDLRTSVAEVDGEDPTLTHGGGSPHSPGITGAGSCMASSTPDMSVDRVSLPCGVPPNPYIAPDSAGDPLCSLA